MVDRTPIIGGRVWACAPEALERLARAEQAWLRGEGPARRQAAQPTDAYRVVGNVAILDVRGIILRYDAPAWFSLFGIESTSVERLRTQLDDALADSSIRGIFFDVDSPGGEVDGVATLADEIFAARGKIATAAHSNELAASAALWIGTQAERFDAAQTGTIGSMGVYLVVMDMTGMAAELGIKVHLVRTGEHKGLGVPGTAVSDANLAMLQEYVDDTMVLFRKAVARGRGDRLSAEDLNALSDARILSAQRAKKIGLIDAVRPVETSLAALGKAATQKPQRSAEMVSAGLSDDGLEEATETEVQMTDQKKDPVATFAAEHTEAVEGWREEGRKEARATETKRAQALLAAFPGREKFALEQFVVGADVKDARAAGFEMLEAELAEEKKANSKVISMTAAKDDDEPGIGFVAPEAAARKATDVSQLSPEERWEKDAALRAEFGGIKKAWLAYMRHEGQTIAIGGDR